MTNDTNTTPAGAATEPCPYCATTPHPKDHVEWEAEITEYAIRCPNCGALGPNDISLDRAREMWNLRRTPNAQHEQLQQRFKQLQEGHDYWRAMYEGARDSLYATQDAIISLTTERDALAAELAAVRAQLAGAKPGIVWQLTEVDMPALEAELAALRAEPRYVPVEIGMAPVEIEMSYYIEEVGDDAVTYHAAYLSDESIAIDRTCISWGQHENIRLCRLAPGQDTQPGDGQE